MLLFKLKPLLLGVSLASTFVSALPFPSYSSEVDVTGREYDELFPRANILFASDPDRHMRRKAVKFLKSIPTHYFVSNGGQQRSIYKADSNNNRVHHDSKIDHGHRLDFQGTADSGKHHNIQVQLNGVHNTKSSVGGLQVNPKWSARQMKRQLIHAIRHTVRDRAGNQYLRIPGLGPIDGGNSKKGKGGNMIKKGKEATMARKAKRRENRRLKKANPESKWARKAVRMDGRTRKQGKK